MTEASMSRGAVSQEGNMTGGQYDRAVLSGTVWGGLCDSMTGDTLTAAVGHQELQHLVHGPHKKDNA